METRRVDMKRLYLQFYMAVLGVVLLFSIFAAGTFWFMDGESQGPGLLRKVEAFADTVTPSSDASVDRLKEFAVAISENFDANVAIYDADRRPLASAGGRVPKPPLSGGSQWLRPRGRHDFGHDPGSRPRRGPRHQTLAIALSDGRWIILEGERGGRPITHLFAALAILTAATGIAAYPLARRLTRRLEALKNQVDALGVGHLDQRATVEGSDEIADLANAFNRTADRIQELVADKTRLLANTSHELRTPLTRIRMAVALLDDGPRPDLLERIALDIDELDDLIGELLISSRLDAPEQTWDRENVDLLALAAEEAARIEGVDVHGTSQIIDGDPRLLRRLVRNLLENAIRHGEPPVDVEVLAHDGDADDAGGLGIRLIVADRGPGIPESERERIFESFYRPAGQASAEGGIGLGLALVRQIAERHQGRIRCEARQGGGTRFVLDLPTAAPAT
jgi:two-component system OmpR family sensor kinase